ncbi:MAG: hypothetical protein ACTSRZ_04700 [Promethearchaeota archaeon]
MTIQRFRRFNRSPVKTIYAQIDKNTSLSIFDKGSNFYCVIKKDLVEYNSEEMASPVPITHGINPDPEPFEIIIEDIAVFKKEIVPVVTAIKQQFGDDKIFELNRIRLAIGKSYDDFITIDESDLSSMEVEPSISGLIKFLDNNKEGVIGFCNREFQPERGNVIFFESNIRNPHQEIKLINIYILSSIQQRGLFMQKEHKFYGIQLYITIKCNNINNELLKLLKKLGIEWELIFLRRDLAISNWTEIECEHRAFNLRGYLKNKYPELGFFDINNITRLVVNNNLTFKVADKIGEVLNKVKIQREQGEFPGLKSEKLKKEEIVAAAEIALAYFGETLAKPLKLDKDVKIEDVAYFKELLINNF